MTLTKKQITILHVAKAKLGLDEDTYRDALEANAGVRSAKNMNYGGFLRVMKHFEKAGFKVQSLKLKAERKSKTRPGMATDAQIKKIKAVWLTLAGSYYTRGQEWRALRGFLKKRFRVEHENFLNLETAGKVIEAIKNIGQRSSKLEATSKDMIPFEL